MKILNWFGKYRDTVFFIIEILITLSKLREVLELGQLKDIDKFLLLFLAIIIVDFICYKLLLRKNIKTESFLNQGTIFLFIVFLIVFGTCTWFCFLYVRPEKSILSVIYDKDFFEIAIQIISSVLFAFFLFSLEYDKRDK